MLSLGGTLTYTKCLLKNKKALNLPGFRAFLCIKRQILTSDSL
jgi:hypothetical protein